MPRQRAPRSPGPISTRLPRVPRWPGKYSRNRAVVEGAGTPVESVLWDAYDGLIDYACSTSAGEACQRVRGLGNELWEVDMVSPTPTP